MKSHLACHFMLNHALGGVAGRPWRLLLVGAGRPWRLLLVGAGRLEGEMRAWAKRHGDRVRLCKDVRHADVPAYLNAMDVLCAPSQTTPGWREQFGRMLIEGFASGVPVLGSDSGEIPFVLDGIGLVRGERDEAGWVEALGELLTDASLRADLAKRGLETARARYDWKNVARKHLDFFDELLVRSGK